MNIQRNISNYIVFSDDSLSYVLQKITDNQKGIVFVLSLNGVLEGVLTDGDFRRWLLSTSKLSLTAPASDALNSNYVYAHVNTPAQEIESLFSNRIEFVPLVDDQHRLVGIASGKPEQMVLGDKVIGDEHPAFIIAEIGNNHNGSLALALQLIDEAHAAGADCAKFQMRDLGSMYKPLDAGGASEDLGAQYTLDLLKRFQLKNEELFQAFDHCKSKGMLPLCTPWDQASLAALEAYGMKAYKIASADLTNPDLISAACATGKPLICSTGMSNEAEIIAAISQLKAGGTQFALLHCNSTYPAPFKDINLRYLERLKSLSSGAPVGYSGHERGYSVALAAIANGAKIIEKHFTMDRSMEGNDHKVSLTPPEFKAMVDGIREIEQALGNEKSRIVSQGEMMNREVLGKSVISNRLIMPGEEIKAEYLDIRSPGKGLPPYKKHALIGLKAKREITAGSFFYPSDLELESVKPRDYQYSRPFGVPVRYHDTQSIVGCSNFDLLEFHFSFHDLEIQPEDFLSAQGYPMDYVVHSPELFAGDHVMDLCAKDPVYRERSIAELQRVVDVTRGLKKFFHKSGKPLIIINAGGFSMDGFIPKSQRKAMYALIEESLSRVDTEGVEIIPQTMPPFPWHFGGQRFHNLFMEADEIAEFCSRTSMRVCLDISHSKLACNHLHASFSEFLDIVAPLSAHIHVVDAAGVDGEGLQIQEGDIDFTLVGEKLNRLCPSASFIPEIWQGHKNNGEGFWIALNRLEKYL